ncbi:epimerase, partial [Microbacterium sp. gxy059]|uniref:epimerase n=1 Tax=Microbacterium sp. gxy059 TaxID=2957199 RepID=UPI003D96D882
MAQPVAVIAGATGFVGTTLSDELTREGYEIRTIGRSGPVRWDRPGDLVRAVDGADLVVGLSGKPVHCRYTDRNRDEILRSRTETTRALRQAIERADAPPPVWMNASTATIYRYAMDRSQTESTGEIGEGFSVDVAREWERELFAGDLPGTRRVALRITIALGDGPATNLLFRLARLGLGGPQIDGWWPAHRRYRGIGSDPSGPGITRGDPTHGRQRFSWVHIDDLIRAIAFLRDRDDIAGPVNIASPHPSDNRELMATLRRVVGMPIGIPAWRFMLEPAMWALRTEPELVLKSRWVLPERLLEAGFVFSQPDLEQA